tara:strand:- start:153 stop:641 length:489 start_codon:yes stop_codon:yes gene_type:complete
MNEKKDRVDDALHATKAAIEEGVLPGGGVALLGASTSVPLKDDKINKLSDFDFGINIVKEACRKPFTQILLNAGYELDIIEGLSKEVDELDWAGYDLKNTTVTNLKEAGIIDPFKVTRSALQNASSIAGTILLTEATIVEKPSENNQPQMDPAAMMGMGMGM